VILFMDAGGVRPAMIEVSASGANSGSEAVTSRPRRVRTLTVPSTETIARQPSHFG
jgi:hypothetical protein